MFTNSSLKLQCLNGVYLVMENDKLMHVVGSFYDCTANLTVMGKLGHEAPGYACLIDNKDIVPDGAMIGDILEEEYLKGTSYEGKNHINLVLHSISIVFFVPGTISRAPSPTTMLSLSF